VVSQDPSPIEVVIAASETGERLDKVLAGRGLGLSRSQLQVLFEAGRIEADGASARVRTPAREGMRVVVRPLPPPPSAAEPEDLPIEILFEDAEVIVVAKAAGMVVHPAPGHASGTLVNALRYHRDMTDVSDESTERPGIVHRLDKDTSGVMVVAKTMRAREALTEQFQVHSIEREYVALVVGHPPSELTLDTLHGRHPRDRKKFTSKVTRGKRAVTHVRVLEKLQGVSLVACRLETGRTHQIRVHLSEHGHPILGDEVYGRSSPWIARQALHAKVLGFTHPVTREALRFEMAIPEDFQRALEGLRLL
jgi:23S rRNA pseudouridine1911/1915/1917 synthase